MVPITQKALMTRTIRRNPTLSQANIVRGTVTAGLLLQEKNILIQAVTKLVMTARALILEGVTPIEEMIVITTLNIHLQIKNIFVISAVGQK